MVILSVYSAASCPISSSFILRFSLIRPSTETFLLWLPCALLFKSFSASGLFSQSVQWALHAGGAERADVGVDHGGFQVGVAQQFLDGADVDA